MSLSSSSVLGNLEKHVSLFGIRLWILIVAAGVIVLLFVVLFIWYCCKNSNVLHFRWRSPKFLAKTRNVASFDKRLLWSETEIDFWKHEREFANRSTSFRRDLELFSFNSPPTVFDVATPRTRYSIHEIEVATRGFARENMVGGGDYSIVYHGDLQDSTRVAVKVLLHGGRLQDEEFKREVMATVQITHRNLAKLLGYCLVGDCRMLVYQYLDNGSLHQWLHRHRGTISPLTWDRRMKIILGTATGLAYIHEDIEPRVIHLNVKSTNILLDQQWNPKISDLGLARLYDHGSSDEMSPRHHSSYATPERVSSEILTAKTDVYCFGILVMEIVTGRPPKPPKFLLDRVKSLIADHKTVNVVDPKIPQLPSLKELKRVLLIALRCVDSDTNHRPTMGEVIHMLEPRDLLIGDELSHSILNSLNYEDANSANLK